MASFVLSILSVVGILLIVAFKITFVFMLVGFFIIFVILKKLFRDQKNSGGLTFLPIELRSRVPKNWEVNELLRKAHKEYRFNLKKFPELVEHTENLWQSFLMELKYLNEPIEWKFCIRKLLDAWPRWEERPGWKQQEKKYRSKFESTVDKTKKTYEMWKQSESEVAYERGN